MGGKSPARRNLRGYRNWSVGWWPLGPFPLTAMNHFPDEAIGLAEQLIRQFEGCRLEAYLDVRQVPTIGWGDTRNVQMGMTISQAEADQRLQDQLSEKAQGVDGLLKVDLSAPCAAALVDFAYNAGVNALAGSTLLRLLNSGNPDAVPGQLLRWNRSNGVEVAGLTRRRQAEADLWNSDV